MTQSLGISRSSRSSTMKQWMRKNRVRFAIELSEAVRPNWVEIAQTLSDLGLRDSKGLKPNKNTAMMTWRRLCAEKQYAKQTVPTYPTPDYPRHNQKEKPINHSEPDGAEERLERLKKQINRRSMK